MAEDAAVPPARSPLAGEQATQGLRPQRRRGGTEVHLTKTARHLRKESTIWERKLWRHVKQDQLGVRFRRQQPIDRYIADFVCFERRLVIELDGSQHQSHTAQDAERDAVMRAKGYSVLRFWNAEIDGNMEGVLSKIRAALSPHDAPFEGGAPAPPQGGSAQVEA